MINTQNESSVLCLNRDQEACKLCSGNSASMLACAKAIEANNHELRVFIAASEETNKLLTHLVAETLRSRTHNNEQEDDGIFYQSVPWEDGTIIALVEKKDGEIIRILNFLSLDS